MIKPIAPLSLLGALVLLLGAGLAPVLAVSMDKSSSTKESAVMIREDAVPISGYQPDVSHLNPLQPKAGTNQLMFSFLTKAARA
jgi:hypothetical protein